MSTTENGVPGNDSNGGFDAATALLNRWMPDDQKGPSGADEKDKRPPHREEDEDKEKPEVEETDEDEKSVRKDQDDSDDADASSDDDEGDEDADKPAKREYVEKDDAYVKVKIGDEDHEFSVKDLKRLAGQEQALTRKGQEVAARRKALEEAQTVHVKAFESMLERARKEWEPYSKVNFFAAAKDPNISAGELEALQAEAQRRWDNLQFLESGLGDLNKTVTKQKQEAFNEAAQECVKVLSDPVNGIEGFGKQKYNELVQYAVEQGVPVEFMSTLADPAAYKIINDAMLYRKGRTRVKVEKDRKKPARPPQKVIKTSNSGSGTKEVISGSKVSEAAKRLRKTGTTDDAAELLLARWSKAKAE